MNNDFLFGEKRCSLQEPCLIVAEISVNFDGSLQVALESIERAVESGADVVKFQTWTTEEFVFDKSLSHTYSLSSGEKVTESQFSMFKRLELREEWHSVLQDKAINCGVPFFSSAADKNAVDLLVNLSTPAIKIASEDLINIRLLEYVAKSGFPTILSTGMADQEEIDRAVSIFEAEGQDQLMLLHCVSCYPAPPVDMNLLRMKSLSDRYQCLVGFSDHSIGIEAASLAVAMGARMIEKHFTIDRDRKGPDHALSSDPEEFRRMVLSIRRVEELLGSPEVSFAACEAGSRIAFRRSIVAARDLRKGECLHPVHLAFKRPGDGLRPYQEHQLIGRSLLRDIAFGEKILLSDVADG